MSRVTKSFLLSLVGAAALLLAGCSPPITTLESRDGTLTVTEQRGARTRKWEGRIVATKAEVKMLRLAGWTFATTIHQEAGPDAYFMRRALKTAPTAAAASGPPLSHTLLITNMGAHASPDGAWTVDVALTNRAVYVTRSEKLHHDGLEMSVASTTSRDGWKAREGWFVFVENECRVWAYDGDRDLVLFQHSGLPEDSHESISGPAHFDCPVPEEVHSRLSAPARDAIKGNN